MTAQPARSILIVEDERIVAKDLQQSLRDMGYDAFATAASAEEAVACATEKRPEIVLMDIRIKGIDDGIRTAALLKKRFHVSIIYLTAHADAGMIERAKKTEPNGYLLKPVKAGELRCMLEMVLYQREMEQMRDRLTLSERRLAVITENVPVSIGYLDRDGRVQFANRVFRDRVQGAVEAAGGSGGPVEVTTVYRDSYVARQRALAGEQATFIIAHADHGTDPGHEITYFPDRDAHGAVVGVYSIGLDVAGRERRIEELRRAGWDP